MSETKKRKLPILPMFIALLILGLIFYVRSENQPLQAEKEEMTQSAIGLPEDKIIKFVVDKVTDVIRLFPQRSHVSSGE